ncbi:hypothetical protein [Xenorhabdus ehlersii]|uniref:hypothetical protein n=1 Tax=Xenorhabdus ehlersii TaxID=290111 RepID=UPI001FC9C579|nr:MULTISPECIES: hypothetical protein [Xenorhabdus]
MNSVIPQYLQQNQPKSDRPRFWPKNKEDIDTFDGLADPFQCCGYMTDGWREYERWFFLFPNSLFSMSFISYQGGT